MEYAYHTIGVLRAALRNDTLHEKSVRNDTRSLGYRTIRQARKKISNFID